MKKILLLFAIAAFIQALHSQDKYCDPSVIDEVNSFKMSDRPAWLNNFTFHLPKWKDKTNEKLFKMRLTKDNKYRLVAKNSPKFPGKMNISLVNELGEQILSAHLTDNEIKTYDFAPKNTGFYKLQITYPDGKEGCGALALFYVGEI